MRRIGRVLHMSPSEKAVIKTSRPLRIGENVFDENKKFVGKVFDVFGPVRTPYVEVDVKNRRASDLVGKMLYQLPSKRKKRSKKRK
ncbi:hypothetical protein CW704_05160 [Candidatus Bathyarchaeota archaeon]|nr:MAG: hypothetical protein CW704_05160 [Candidatus Bathyarchaeota archaeon]